MPMLMLSDAHDATQQQRYEDDLLLANWNPALELLAMFADDAGENARRDPVAECDDGFLDRIYAHATHI